MSDALFAELDRLQAVDAADQDAMRAEIERAKAVRDVAATIIDNNKFVLDVAKANANINGKDLVIPKGLLS